jgi:hypothetical protein
LETSGQAAATSSVDNGQLIFTDPQTAALKFTLHYTGGATCPA